MNEALRAHVETRRTTGVQIKPFLPALSDLSTQRERRGQQPLQAVVGAVPASQLQPRHSQRGRERPQGHDRPLQRRQRQVGRHGSRAS